MEDTTMQQIFELLNKCAADIGVIKKTKQPNSTVNYAYRSIDQVINALGVGMQKYNLVLKIEQLTPPQIHFYQTQNARGATIQATTAIVNNRYYIIAPDSSFTFVDESAQSNDNGDKAVSQANSLAYKHAICRLFSIPTEERDPDADSTERVIKANVAKKTQSMPVLRKIDENGEITPVWLAIVNWVKNGGNPEKVRDKYTVSDELMSELKAL
jgi:hypothetical protein